VCFYLGVQMLSKSRVLFDYLCPFVVGGVPFALDKRKRDSKWASEGESERAREGERARETHANTRVLRNANS